MIMLDTHVWVWFVGDPDKLSPRSRDEIDKAVKEDKILISSISSWEIAMLVSRMTAFGRPKVKNVNFKLVGAIKSVNLPGFSYNDPADRIIVATAMAEGATLVAKDRKLLDYSEVRSVW